MRYSILVYQSQSHQSARTALTFAQTLLEKGHHIDRIFFYGEAVHLAHQTIDVPEDEFDLANAWRTFAKQSAIPMQLCVAAAARRGITESTIENINTTHEAETPSSKLTIELVGLGELACAVRESDRVITFGQYQS